MRILAELKKELTILASIIVIIVSFLTYFENRYAVAKEVEVIEARVCNLEYDKAVTSYYDLKALLLKYPEDNELQDQVSKAKEKLLNLKSKLESEE